MSDMAARWSNPPSGGWHRGGSRPKSGRPVSRYAQEAAELRSRPGQWREMDPPLTGARSLYTLADNINRARYGVFRPAKHFQARVDDGVCRARYVGEWGLTHDRWEEFPGSEVLSSAGELHPDQGHEMERDARPCAGHQRERCAPEPSPYVRHLAEIRERYSGSAHGSQCPVCGSDHLAQLAAMAFPSPPAGPDIEPEQEVAYEAQRDLEEQEGS